MSTRATIHKALLNIANMDTHYYNEHNLTIALHPSETHERLMARVVAFILNASDDLAFCKGIDEDDQPDLWEKDHDGTIKLWIDLGQVDEKRIKKACISSEQVIIYTYQQNMATPWFKKVEGNLHKFKNLSIIHLNMEEEIEKLADRSINLQCNISDEELTLISSNETMIIHQEKWK